MKKAIKGSGEDFNIETGGGAEVPVWCFKDNRGRIRQKERCGDSYVFGFVGNPGCQGFIHPKEFNYSPRLCLHCSNKLAAEWDVPFELLGAAVTIHALMEWYKERMEDLRLYTRSRIMRSMLFAMGLLQRDITAEEFELAQLIATRFPAILATGLSMPQPKLVPA